MVDFLMYTIIVYHKFILFAIVFPICAKTDKVHSSFCNESLDKIRQNVYNYILLR